MTTAPQECRTDGRCQYAIEHGAEGMGHCPKGKCVMPAQRTWVGLTDEDKLHIEAIEAKLKEKNT